MEISQEKLEANRRNAALSTGPKSESGKRKASLNALRHGLTAQVVVLPGEDMAQYLTFTKTFVQDLRPDGVVETQLAQSLADYQWRLNRFRALEASLFALGHEKNADTLDLGDDPRAAEMQTALAAAQTLRDNLDTLKTLSIYEVRLNRQFHATLAQFRAAQTLREERLKNEVFQATRIYKLHKTKNRLFLPAEFGFVSTIAQLAMVIRRSEALSGRLEPPKLHKVAS